MSSETIYAPDPLASESDMLPEDPPPRIVRFIAWWLLGLFVLGLLGAILFPLPETVHAPFVLVAKEGADPIQSPRLATINHVAVKEGDVVPRGGELFVLESDEIRGLAEDLKTREITLAKLDETYKAEAEIKDAQVSQAESELRFREKGANSNRDLLARLEKLSKSGGFSQVELIRLRLDAAGAEKDLLVAQRTLEQVRLERQQMESEHVRKRAEEDAELRKLKVRLAGLKSDQENTQHNYFTIRAPFDAVVVSLAQRTAGGVVQSGQELCQLARSDVKPEARLSLSESSLAQLVTGQTVRYFFEAFPYQRYGMVTGKLEWVSPSAVAGSDGGHFVALSSLEGNKKGLALKPGMRGEARVVVGRRTLIEYAFEPIKQLKEGVR